MRKRSPGKCLTFLLIFLVLLAIPAYFLMVSHLRSEEADKFLKVTATPRTQLRLALNERAGSLLLQWLADGSLDDQEKLDLYSPKDPDEIWPLLETGEIDAALTTSDRLALNLRRFPNVKVLFAYDLSQSYDGLLINSRAQAENCVNAIACVEGSAGQFLALNYAAIPVDHEVKVVTVPTYEQAEQMLKKGQVQGAALIQPAVNRLLYKEKGYELSDLNGRCAIHDIWVASQATLSDEATAQRLAKTADNFFNLIQTAQTSPGIVMKAISRLNGLSTSDNQEIFAGGLKWFTPTEAKFQQENLAGLLRENGKFWSLCGAYKYPFTSLDRDVASAVDQQFVLALRSPQAQTGTGAPEETATPAPTLSPETGNSPPDANAPEAAPIPESASTPATEAVPAVPTSETDPAQVPPAPDAVNDSTASAPQEAPSSTVSTSPEGNAPTEASESKGLFW